MNKKMETVKADNPLSITDGAPETVEICGQRARLPATMDYRIANLLMETCGIDDTDSSVAMLYCCLHTTKTQIHKLWQAARKPKKLWEDICVWQAGVPVDTLTDAINGLMSFNDDLDDEEGEQEEPGKKKTGSR